MLPTDPLIGSKLGDYEVIEPVGEGGMGVVYKGVHPLIKKRVAIKVLKPGAASDQNLVKRLVAEAEAVNAVGHRNIIDIFGLGQLPDGRPYIVMEFLDGTPLDLYLRNNTRAPLDETLRLFLEICSPIAAAHAVGVIHRDMKPSNVFICQQPDGTRYLKLLDFGLAKRAQGGDGTTAQTSTTEVSGTPDYMAPEQARGLSVSPRTDIYALGVMLYELVTGELPFRGATPMDVMVAQVSAPIPTVREKFPEAPEALEALVTQMLAKAPEDRPQSIDEVRERLHAFLGDAPSSTSGRQRATPHSGMLRRTSEALAVVKDKGWLLPALGALLFVGVCAVLVSMLLREPDENAVAPTRRTTRRQPLEPQPLAAEPSKPAELPAPTPPAQKDDEGLAMPTPTPTKGEDDIAVPPPKVDDADAPPPALKKFQPPRTTSRRQQLKLPPTLEALKARVTNAEKALKKMEEPDPSALTFLKKYKVKVQMVQSPLERAELAKELSEFERTFLHQ